MSDFTVIHAASLSLRAVLRRYITDSAEPQVSGVAIDLRSPKEMQAPPASQGISLWLYRVTRNSDQLNLPPRRISASQTLIRPLPVDLHYLLTPLVSDAEDRQKLLGRALQALNDHSILRGADLQGALQGGDEELRVNLEPLSMEDLTRVWQSLQEPYLLSVSYMVQVALIDSDHEPTTGSPVLRYEGTAAQILDQG